MADLNIDRSGDGSFVLEVDDVKSDSSSMKSSTGSIPSEFLRTPTGSSVIEPDSVMAENGREYHGYKEGKYFLPNDAAEQDRLDLQHCMITIALDGRLAVAPIENPGYVLDVATGTGIWALEFAEANPLSHVIGTDLSKIQPQRNLLNCEFIKEDAEEEWLFPLKFDYIHLRMVVTCFAQPRLVFDHAINALNPGGWIEYHDLLMESYSDDGSATGTASEKLNQFLKKGLELSGRNPHVAASYKEWMLEAGLVDVVETKQQLPCNGWPDDPKLKRVGQYCLADLYDGARGICWKLCRLQGMSPEEIEAFIVQVQKDIANPEIKAYWNLYVVYGRKPLADEIKEGSE